ncbi:SEL1-like repeat protein [Sulfurovum sp.]|uniref:SEL1-like repeat protein n=1 Tax=Sulfurovum sp. TaxID=1969726 RepID=UPI002867D54D|nr:SEL1-like repeat protein [Sulfurovum sp.]
MKVFEYFENLENIELYLIIVLIIVTLWLMRNTVKFYKGEKRKIKHLHRFAKEGEEDSQYKLAQRFQKGDMVKRSCNDAAFWYQRAAFSGNADAKNKINKILKKKRC